jgi:dephospho-CoA kinase
MLRVGLTGGLASGKSLVAKCLARLGCHWIQADQLGHEALRKGSPVQDEVVRRFGPDILLEDGEIDRRKLAATVFDAPERLAALNALVHPAVIRREEELTQEIAKADPSAIIVVEAAILIETGSYTRFQKLILAVCEESQQVQRAMKRSGLTREEVLARLQRQMPLEQKWKYADYIVDTSGSKEDTFRQVEDLYRTLRTFVI